MSITRILRGMIKMPPLQQVVIWCAVGAAGFAVLDEWVRWLALP